jgi:hypothetical protein
MALPTQSKPTIKETRLSYTRLLLALALVVGLLCSCAAEQAQPAPLAGVSPTASAHPQPAVAPSASTAAESPPTLPEPCALLTQVDLANTLAETFHAGEAGALPVGTDAAFVPKNCAFQSGDKQVVLTLIPASSPYQEQKELAASAHTLLTVNDLGDEAFWETDSNELWVAQSQSTLVLGFYFIDTSVEAAKSLMQQALSRLK